MGLGTYPKAINRFGLRWTNIWVCGQRLPFVGEYAIPATTGNIYDKSPKHGKRSQLIILGIAIWGRFWYGEGIWAEFRRKNHVAKRIPDFGV